VVCERHELEHDADYRRSSHQPVIMKVGTSVRMMKNMPIIALSIFATVIVTILILNFTPSEKKIESPIPHLYNVESDDFLLSMNHLLGPRLIDGNKVTSLRNGIEIFPAMLTAIRSATLSICFETYIYWSEEIGREFSQALAAKAREGVKVHVILDWAGAGKMDEASLNTMKEAGVLIELFHPLKWYNLSRLNNRTHRKLLIIDGKIGFTGGVGIADQWLGNAESKERWRDSHFKLEGPAVAQMQAAFIDNWIKTNATVLHGADYFPKLQAVGPALAQVFKSSYDDGSESTRLMYLLSIASAKTSILIATAYFVPDDLSVQMLIDAKKRGVHVEILVPGPEIDMEIVRKASRARWGKLLEAGIKIFEYQPTMYHCKVMIVDSLLTSVGSTNFDNRSFRLNAEANLNVYDPELALVQTKEFENDKKYSKEFTYESWKNRPLKEKLLEHASAIFRSQL